MIQRLENSHNKIVSLACTGNQEACEELIDMLYPVVEPIVRKNLSPGEEKQDGTMYYKHDADAFITKGTAKIIVDIVNGEQKTDIAELTLESFKGLGIRELLTMQRQVGFASLIEKIIRIAKYG